MELRGRSSVLERMTSRLWRALAALALVLGVSAVPIATVMACDCMFTELPDAVRDADVAFVGTLAGSSEAAPAIDRGLPPEQTWTWTVERSRDPIDATRVDVVAWEDDGANCGVSFATNERWLVLGYLEDGRLLTNSCMRNQRLDGSDPDGEAIIASLITAPVESSPSEAGIQVPAPVLVATGMALALVVVGAVAFRTRRGDPT
jgi:hypothetical protein